MNAEVRPIRLRDLISELSPTPGADVVIRCLEELCIAEALVIIHGEARGAQLYIAHGGHVRFDAQGEPVWLWTGEVPPSPFGE
jgi:hypothetical protein